MSLYYLADGNDRRGPFSAEQLPSQGITAETLVWREGLPDWLRADAIPELHPYLPAPARPGYGYTQPQQPQYGYPQQGGYPQQTGYSQQQGYPPQVGYSPYAAGGSNGMAVAAMVLGIVSIVLFWIPILGILIGALALILGVLAMKNPVGSGMSLAGIVCGGIGGLIALVFTIYFFVNYDHL